MVDAYEPVPLAPTDTELANVNAADVTTVNVRRAPSNADKNARPQEGHPISATNVSGSQDSPEPEPQVHSDTALVAALLRGARLESLPRDLVTPQFMETVGRLLDVAAQGAVDLLAGRSAIKQEVHIAVTLINPRSNNPLKFLPDGQTALMQMLGPKIPGFMPAVQAMQEAMRDLVAHQSAVAAGTQATIEALFRRFDPQSIEAQHPQHGMGEKMSKTVYQARLWNSYQTQYRQVRDEVQDDFFKRLGAEFQDAYNKEYGPNGRE